MSLSRDIVNLIYSKVLDFDINDINQAYETLTQPIDIGNIEIYWLNQTFDFKDSVRMDVLYRRVKGLFQFERCNIFDIASGITNPLKYVCTIYLKDKKVIMANNLVPSKFMMDSPTAFAIILQAKMGYDEKWAKIASRLEDSLKLKVC